MRGRLGPVRAPDRALRIEQEIGGCGVPLLHLLLGLVAGHVALLARSGGADGEPDDALAGVLLLQLLHVSAAVVLADERTLEIHPLEHDEFAPEGVEADGLPVHVAQLDRGPGLSDDRGSVGMGRRQEQQAEGKGEGGESNHVGSFLGTRLPAGTCSDIPSGHAFGSGCDWHFFLRDRSSERDRANSPTPTGNPEIRGRATEARFPVDWEGRRIGIPEDQGDVDADRGAGIRARAVVHDQHSRQTPGRGLRVRRGRRRNAVPAASPLESLRPRVVDDQRLIHEEVRAAHGAPARVAERERDGSRARLRGQRPAGGGAGHPGSRGGERGRGGARRGRPVPHRKRHAQDGRARHADIRALEPIELARDRRRIDSEALGRRDLNREQDLPRVAVAHQAVSRNALRRRPSDGPGREPRGQPPRDAERQAGVAGILPVCVPAPPHLHSEADRERVPRLDGRLFRQERGGDVLPLRGVGSAPRGRDENGEEEPRAARSAHHLRDPSGARHEARSIAPCGTVWRRRPLGDRPLKCYG